MKAAERVIFNTVILYARLILVIAIGLFTTRIVLDSLGETNYGIYNLVAGTVGMLAFLNSAMSSTSMRYMAYSLGSGDDELISRTFNTTLLLHFIIGLGLLIFIEIGGYFMFKHVLDIPQDNMFEAKIVFHLMAVTTFVAIIAVPYDAVINSHENLLALSVTDIIGAILKLIVAIYLTFTSFNLLIIYSLGMFLVQLVMRIIKQQYSVKHYKECKLNLKHAIDKNLSREIMSFSGWNLFGSISSISVTQAHSILLNMFFGVKVNASEGISRQVKNHVNNVSVNLTRAINPQLVKSEGSGNRKKMLRITALSTKFSVFLFALFAIPVILELPFLMKIWLKDVPEYAVIFARLLLIGMFIEKLSFEITAAVRASGKIKQFIIFNTSIIIMNVPLTYIFFYFDYPPQTIYEVTIFITIVILFVRLNLGRKIVQLNVSYFLKHAIVPSLLPVCISIIVGIVPLFLIKHQITCFMIVSLTSMISLIISFYLMGMTEQERFKIKNIGIKCIKKIQKVL